MVRAFLLLMLVTQLAFGACEVVKGKGDPLAKLLATVERCPANVFELRALIKKAGYDIQTSLVANQSFHNPGSNFSLFEMVVGDGVAGKLDGSQLMFGHFTATDGDTLIANQDPVEDNLMIELEGQDPLKDNAFNFYELFGQGGGKSQWFYRGDTISIVKDLKRLHLSPPNTKNQFGNTLRCSGCHLSGGPIIKESLAPHNDWWTKERPLNLGLWKIDPALNEMIKQPVDASVLSAAVDQARERLVKNDALGDQLAQVQSLPERLRPLFCPMEINIESDDKSINEDDATTITIPSAFFAEKSFGEKPVTVSKELYLKALRDMQSHLRGFDPFRTDADHAWLTPVKAKYDILAARELIRRKVITQDFFFAVLGVDFTNPVFSKERCELLKQVPPTPTEGWEKEFMKKMPAPSTSIRRASFFLGTCETKWKSARDLRPLVELLFQRRAEVKASAISGNPRGQILEPNFRIIFPTAGVAVTPGKLKFNPNTCEVEN